jgi:hypothetical protein
MFLLNSACLAVPVRLHDSVPQPGIAPFLQDGAGRRMTATNKVQFWTDVVSPIMVATDIDHPMVRAILSADGELTPSISDPEMVLSDPGSLCCAFASLLRTPVLACATNLTGLTGTEPDPANPICSDSGPCKLMPASCYPLIIRKRGPRGAFA